MTLKSTAVATAPAAGLIYVKMATVMASLSAISKDRQNDQQRYKFRGIDDCMNALHPVLSINGVFYTAAVRDLRQREYATKSGTAMLHIVLTVAYTFHAEDGSSVSFEAVGEASDSGDKAAGKAQAYALKVALLQVFCIPTEEQKDTEYQHPERAAVSTPPTVDAEPLRTELRRILTELDAALGKDTDPRRTSAWDMLPNLKAGQLERSLELFKPQLAQLLETGEVAA